MQAPLPSPDPSLDALVRLLGARTDALVLTEGKDLVQALQSRGALQFLDKIVPLPVSDRATLAMAGVMAWSGRCVIVEVGDASRLPAIVEPLSDACRLAASSDRPLSLVLRVPLLDAAGVAAACAVPGLRVWCAGGPVGAASLLPLAAEAGGPVVLLEPVHGGGGAVSSARPQRWADGRPRATVVACGAAVEAARDAARVLAAEGVVVEVVDPVVVAPIDGAALGARVRDTGRLVVASGVDAGWGARVIQAVLGPCFLYLEAPPAVCAAEPEAIVAAVRAAVSY